jgi:hypothetical protein
MGLLVHFASGRRRYPLETAVDQQDVSLLWGSKSSAGHCLQSLRLLMGNIRDIDHQFSRPRPF